MKQITQQSTNSSHSCGEAIRKPAGYLFKTILISLALLGACSEDDNPTGPEEQPDPEQELTTGSVEITTATSGPDQDVDGYTITVNGGNSQSADTTGTIIIGGLQEGIHELTLNEVAANCSVASDNPQSVTITAGDTTSVNFDISCIEMIENQIVFVSNRDNPKGEIYLMNPDGTGQIRLTNNNKAETYPAISPDGTRVAFTQYNASIANIYVINADGTNRLQLTDSGYLPRWSPDGSQLVFTTDRDGDFEVYIMNADGSGQTNLTNSPGTEEIGGDWSPDGSRIVFYSNRDGDPKIYSVNTDGSGLQKLTDNTGNDYWPRYSPDGTKIAFSSNRDGNYELYAMNADGSGLQRITNNSAADGIVSPASWLSDGSQMVFESSRDGNFEIYMINTDGTGAINLTVNTATDTYPDWSPIQ